MNCTSNPKRLSAEIGKCTMDAKTLFWLANGVYKYKTN